MSFYSPRGQLYDLQDKSRRTSTYSSSASSHHGELRNEEDGASRHKSAMKEVRFSATVDSQSAPSAAGPNRARFGTQFSTEPSHSFPMWAAVSPNQRSDGSHDLFRSSIAPPRPYLSTENALDSRGGGTVTMSELTGESYDHVSSNLLCCGLPLPVTMNTTSDTTGLRGTAAKVLKFIFAVLLDKLPRKLYLNALLHLPDLYSSRVFRILEDAELTVPVVRKLYTPVPPNQVVEELAAEEEEKEKREEEEKEEKEEKERRQKEDPLMSVAHFKSTWESFVDSIMREWKTLNIVSVLLLSAILTMLQIQGAGDDPITRTAALLALVCALMSLLFGCMYVVRFGSMKRTHQALTWAEEAKKINKSIWWNVWVLLAMPAVWLSWSLILFAVCILSFVWRTGSSTSPPSTGTFEALSPRGAVGVRIAITSVFFLGMMYYVLIIKTLRKYGARMDQKWKQKVMEWIEEDMMTVGETLESEGGGTASVIASPSAPVPTTMSLVTHGPSTSNTTSVESNALRLNTIPPPSPPPDVRSSPILPISHAQSPEMVGSSPDLPSHATPLRSVAEIPVKEISNTNTGEPFDSTKAMQLLDPPLAFNRPPSRLSSFIRLDTMRFTELNSFTLGRIKIPFILDDHDIYRDDWIMFIHDLSLAWGGRFPAADLISDSDLPERVQVAVGLVNNWNDKFFVVRRVEVVLCMEEPWKVFSMPPSFALYLTDPMKKGESKGGSSSRQVLPTISWGKCIPPSVRNVVPLTGGYAMRDLPRAAAAGHSSVDLLSLTAVGASEAVGQRRRVNSM